MLPDPHLEHFREEGLIGGQGTTETMPRRKGESHETEMRRLLFPRKAKIKRDENLTKRRMGGHPKERRRRTVYSKRLGPPPRRNRAKRPTRKSPLADVIALRLTHLGILVGTQFLRCTRIIVPHEGCIAVYRNGIHKGDRPVLTRKIAHHNIEKRCGRAKPRLPRLKADVFAQPPLSIDRKPRCEAASRIRNPGLAMFLQRPKSTMHES